MALGVHSEDSAGHAARRFDRSAGPEHAPRPSVPRWPEFPAGVIRILRSGNDNIPHRPEPGPASELDCLRRVFGAEVLAAAEARSHDVAVGADQVLITQGRIGEAAYLDCLAAHTGIEIEIFTETSRADCPLTDSQFVYAARHGILPLRRDGHLTFVVAPRGFTARRLCRLADMYPSALARIRLCSHADLDCFLMREAAAIFGQSAADALKREFPMLSAAPRAGRSAQRWWRRLAQTGLLATLMMLPPAFPAEVGGNLLAFWFLAFIGLRLIASATRPEIPAKRRRLSDDSLPVYTVIIALYREASSVVPLMRGLDAIDYPREKLDIIVVTELDDLATRAALARLGPMPHVRVLTAPPSGPRTKPKALNHALAFARGSFVAVFDAEDRPDPAQLRAALDAFRVAGPDVACAQARLCIANGTESWLSRTFAAEYAGQFDVFLPGLAALGAPLPLGGSSNHFRTSALRGVGGWDAYNVTEDADLGFRLARFGYRSTTFSSTTREEAPARFGGWLRQRTRWMKGWMQTWSVHMRAPVRLWREAGPAGFLTLNAIIGGNVLTALTFPVLVADLLGVLANRVTGSVHWAAITPITPLHLTAIAAGLISTVAIGLAGLARRGHLRRGWILALTPLYWGCLSIAAWRAVYQFLTDPYRWEKTEHGLSRNIDEPFAASRQRAAVRQRPPRRRLRDSA
ncbi:MAG TPA: glycosyltransferase [Nitrobacter sp.]|nr:glycosyltransferase [Nitrobacter sp.]